MVDFMKLAIADVLRHPTLGIISYQPAMDQPFADFISVRDSDFIFHHNILASECEWGTEEEAREYWREVNKIIEEVRKV